MKIIDLLGKAGLSEDFIKQADLGDRVTPDVLVAILEGHIPCVSTGVQKEGQAKVVPLFDRDQMKTLWGALTPMSPEEMDNTLELSRLY